MLWPYTPSALKNQRRWTFGCVFPPAWTAAHPDDACVMRTQVLLESDPHDVDVTVRFLQADGVERSVTPGPFAFGALRGRVDFEVDGPRLTVTIRNTTPWVGEDREEALRHAFCSTHTLLRGGRLRVRDGGRSAARTSARGRCSSATTRCSRRRSSSRTIRGSRPESPGDLFDGGEIDGLLALNIMALDRRGEGRDARGPAHARDPGTHRVVDRGAAVDAVGLPVGTRVKLRPRAGGDVFDLALAGKTAVVDMVETDMEGRVFVGVLVDDDPGRDLGERGHRFFFSPEEVAPLRVLVAGIGNVFLGDDGFGVELAKRVSLRATSTSRTSASAAWTSRTRCADYDVVIFLDATPRGQRARERCT